MILTICAISLWVLSIIGYVIFNLYTKNKKLEDMLTKYVSYSNSMSFLIKEFDEIVNKIDSQIWVQSDPELLGLFENIKEMQKRSKEFLD